MKKNHVIIAALAVILFGAGLTRALANDAKKDRFINECTASNPRFHCDMLWTEYRLVARTHQL